jgi:hypothetical protein
MIAGEIEQCVDVVSETEEGRRMLEKIDRWAPEECKEEILKVCLGFRV